MLLISPEKDKLVSEPLLAEYGADGKDPAVLTAKENGNTLGYIALDLKDYSVRILTFVLSGRENFDALSPEERELADSMIKSAASYGMNRNVFLMFSEYKPAFPLFQNFGFRQIDDKMRIDLSQLIKKCKSCQRI